MGKEVGIMKRYWDLLYKEGEGSGENWVNRKIDGRGKDGALPYQEDLSKIHPGTVDSKQDTEQLNSEHETAFQNSKIEVRNILHLHFF